MKTSPESAASADGTGYNMSSAAPRLSHPSSVSGFRIRKKGKTSSAGWPSCTAARGEDIVDDDVFRGQGPSRMGRLVGSDTGPTQTKAPGEGGEGRRR